MNAPGDPTVPLMVVFFLGIPLLVLGLVLPMRRLRRVGGSLCSALHLVPVKLERSLWPTWRALAPYMTGSLAGSGFYVAQGTRGGRTVEVILMLKRRAEPEMTAVCVGVIPAFDAEVLIAPKRPFAWTLQLSLPTRVMGALGECSVHAEPVEALATLFPLVILARLAELPREILRIEARSGAILISWKGLESDPRVIEEIFQLGADALTSHLASGGSLGGLAR